MEIYNYWPCYKCGQAVSLSLEQSAPVYLWLCEICQIKEGLLTTDKNNVEND